MRMSHSAKTNTVCVALPRPGLLAWMLQLEEAAFIVTDVVGGDELVGRHGDGTTSSEV